jgi:hypothetical protein
MTVLQRVFSKFLLLGLALGLGACSNESNSGPAATVSNAAKVVTGVAAYGAPLTGTISITDASYPPNKTSAPINQDGTFAVDVSDLTPPLLLKAAGTVAGRPITLYSFCTGTGTVQVNPLTNLLVAAASGSQGMSGLFELYSSHNRASMQVIINNLPTAKTSIQSALQPLLALYGTTGTDPFTTPYQINHQGLDGLFDDVTITVANNRATVSNRASGAIIYTAMLDNLGSSTIASAALPSPVSYTKPGNARLTLQLSGLPADTVVKRLKTTIKLPLGVTVDQGAAAVNTALPTAQAASAVVYPLPALSATNNELSLELSALTGFGNGEFLTLRTIVSYSQLDLIRASDYTVLQTQLYGDIYKSSKITGGIITVGNLQFPLIEGEKIYVTFCSGCHTVAANDTVGRPSLRNKGGMVPGKFATVHRGMTLTSLQIEDLQAYLAALQ